MDISGGCLCGAVRYRIAGAPLGTRVCWCRDCQHLAAGNATVNVIFKAADVSIEGALQDYRSLADSGNVMHRRFCPACGTPLFSHSEQRSHLLIVRAGTLDDPEIARPAATIWTARAPSWACIDPALEAFELQPPPVA